MVVAGMERVLASVIGELAGCSVLAVATLVGYGAAQGGTIALLARLFSYALGVGVSNIRNGIDAAVLASRMNHRADWLKRHGALFGTPVCCHFCGQRGISG